MSTSIAAHELRFSWPDGDVVFDGLGFALGAGRTGLVGANGSGKSTLLRLITGELRPAAGSIRVAGTVGYLPQSLVLDPAKPVDEVLGVAGARRALRAIESGVQDETGALFAAVGDDWEVEERTRATLDRLGLDGVGLDRRVGEVSGGEAVLLGLAAQVLRRPAVLLLDEPTNNLDLAARRRLYAGVDTWPGVMVVVSHDRDLLERVDQIAELRDGELRVYGGTFTDYERAVAAEQDAAQRRVRDAGSDLRRQRRELVDAQVKLDRRQRYGRTMWANKREPKIVMGARKRAAQVSAGKHRIEHSEKVEDARERLARAEDAVRDDDEIRVDLPETAVPAGRTVLTVSAGRLRNGTTVDVEIRGPERVALVGDNGSGKTTLLETIVGTIELAEGTLRPAVPLRYLPQRLDRLDDGMSIVRNVARLAPRATDNAIRARLARFLFRGDRADQVVGTLSGGERFRATLAALLTAEPAPQLLMLDEPTNNLDLTSVAALTQALAAYRGALVVASHDLPFLRDIGISRWLRIVDGRVTDVGPQ